MQIVLHNGFQEVLLEDFVEVGGLKVESIVQDDGVFLLELEDQLTAHLTVFQDHLAFLISVVDHSHPIVLEKSPLVLAFRLKVVHSLSFAVKVGSQCQDKDKNNLHCDYYVDI